MRSYFPLQELERGTWTYANADTEVPHRLSGELEDWTIVDDATEYVITWRTDCVTNNEDCDDGAIVRQFLITADYDGVQIHGAGADPSGEDRFDAPIQMADEFVKVGDVFTSSARGNTYTSTLVDFVSPCPVRLPNWNDCAQFELTSDGGEDDVTGTYYAITAYGFVSMDWPDQTGRWELTQHAF